MKSGKGGPQTSLDNQETGTSSAPRAEPTCDRCGRVCKSKSGLTRHQKKCTSAQTEEKGNIACTHCSQAFKTARALSAHKVKAHPCEWNEEKKERHMARRPKHRWTDSDRQLVYRCACEWSKMVKPSLSINDYIRKCYFPELSRDAIKYLRKSTTYKDYVNKQSSRDTLPVVMKY